MIKTLRNILCFPPSNISVNLVITFINTLVEKLLLAWQNILFVTVSPILADAPITIHFCSFYNLIFVSHLILPTV